VEPLTGGAGLSGAARAPAGGGERGRDAIWAKIGPAEGERVFLFSFSVFYFIFPFPIFFLFISFLFESTIC
jgi:hypothetical protein